MSERLTSDSKCPVCGTAIDVTDLTRDNAALVRERDTAHNHAIENAKERDQARAELVKFHEAMERERKPDAALQEQIARLEAVINRSKDGVESLRKWERLDSLERELKDTQILLFHKNETANTFMEQVRKLQQQVESLAELRQLLIETENKIMRTDENRDWLERRNKALGWPPIVTLT